MIYAVKTSDGKVYQDTDRAIIAAIYMAEVEAEFYELNIVPDGDPVIRQNMVELATNIVRPAKRKQK